MRRIRSPCDRYCNRNTKGLNMKKVSDNRISAIVQNISEEVMDGRKTSAEKQRSVVKILREFETEIMERKNE